MNSAEINFAPVCSNCGHIIFNEINFVEEELSDPLTKSVYTEYSIKSYHIKPIKCPHCGCYFKSISIPSKLPYAYNNFELKKKLMTEHPKEYSLTCKGCIYDDGAPHSLCMVCTRMTYDGDDDFYELKQEESK